MNLKKGLFSIPTSDPDNYGTYEGFTFGERWNGFECPLFDKETAVRILKDGGFAPSVKEGEISFTDYDNVVEAIPMTKATFDGRTIELYNMALGWVWEAEEIAFKKGDKVKFYPEFADGDNGIFICAEDSDGDRVKVVFPDSTLNFWKTEIVNTETLYKV